jgi:hypothetical protein
VLDLLLMLLIDIFGSGLLEGLWEWFGSVGSEAKRQHRRLMPILTILGVGLLLGAATCLVLPTRLLHPGPAPGVSVVIVPPVLALWLHTLGLFLRTRGRTPSHLATWYGGAALGVGLTIGRLISLELTAGG